jgi:signal transduction histidine kinase/DNA-binding response OmpR family regulator/ligand-binding sensor domain-containing protein
MLKVKTIHTIVFLLLFVNLQINAQNDIFEIQSIKIEDGLPSNNVHDILQDHNRFIWLSTPGALSRYDGYNFKTYDASFLHINESSTISLDLDSNNNIWFCEGPKNRGIKQSGVIDTRTDSIYNFEAFTKGLFSSKDVLSITSSKLNKNILYISTRSGIIYEYNEKFKAIFKLPISTNHQVQCQRDDKGNYWITYETNKILKVNSQQHIIDSFQIQKRGHDIKKIIRTNPNLIIESQFASQERAYWTIKDNKLIPLEPDDNKSTQIVHITDQYLFFSKNDTLYRRPTNQLENSNNDLVICSIPNFYYHNSLIDKQGLLWITTSNGIIKLVPKPNAFTTLLPNNSIRAVFAENNTVLISGYSGNSTVGSNSKFKYQFEKLNLIATHFIRDDAHNLWVGNISSRLFRYNESLNTLHTYKLKKAEGAYVPFQNPVTKNIWIGKSNGLAYLDANEEIKDFTDFEAINGAEIRQITLTTHGIWIITNKGLFLMNPETEVIEKHYTKNKGLPAANINYFYEDMNNSIWLATKTDGLIKWNFETQSFKQFTTEHGLSNNTIYAVYEDDYNNLWLPSNYGLMRFDKASTDIQVFTIKDGIANNEFNTFAHYKLTDGTLYFGGVNGLTSFHPKDFKNISSENLPIYLTDLRVLEKNAEDFKSRDFKLYNNEPINLNYNDQILEFEVSLLDFSYKSNHQYAYKIDNYHTNWVYTRDHKISLFNFPYGNHNIRVKAKGDSGVWTKNELLIPINVNKPFYLKWQLWLLIITGLFILVLFYFKWRIKRLNTAKVKLEKEVANRTQKIQNDKQLIELQAKELKELDLAKDRFFSNLTHEFRTPLTLILGPLEQILENPPPTSILKRQVTGVYNNARHILGLINQLLDLSKIEQKAMPIEVVQTDIVAHTEALAKRLQPLFTKKNQKFTFETNKKEWVTYFDPDKWDKIVFNLLSNAIKFTPKKGDIQLTLMSVNHQKEETIKLIVKDSGVGIDQKNKNAVFNRFYQVDISSTRANEGTGIGLALVKELVELQHGHISVKSELNKGSTFEIILPVLSQSTLKPHQPKTSVGFLIPDEQPEESYLNKNKDNEKLEVLIIEDNADMRDYIYQCLGTQNYAITMVKNGDEGLKKALSLIPDLIISDVMMPKKNGFEVTEAIRANLSTSHIPLILLTAKTSLDSKLQGLKRGADAYLTKPFSPKELKLRVNNLIALRTRFQNRYAKDDLKKEDSFEQEDMFILQLKDYIHSNLNSPDLNGDTIGLHFGLSRIHLYRKLKALTDSSISEFVRNIRLEKGLDLVQQKKLNISEIAFETGFASVSHFSRSFKAKYGKSPSQM